MRQLELASRLEKNKISNTTAFLTLLEIIIPGLNENIRLVYNNEDVSWGGYNWIAFPFSLGEVTENKTELPSITLSVSNVNKVIGRYIEQVNGATGASIIIRDINTANLNAVKPDWEETFSVQSTNTDDYNVTFKLSADSATTLRRPWHIYQGRHCRSKYGSVVCGYVGDLLTCGKTKEDCEAHDNVERWNAEFGISGTLYN